MANLLDVVGAIIPTNSKSKKSNNTIWWIIGIVFLFLLIRGDLKTFFANKEKDSAGSDPVARLALLLRDAFNPSGIPLLINFDGTANASVYELAAQIANYEAVAASYSVQFGENLTERLSKELNTEEFNKFFQIVSSKNGNVPNTQSAIGKTAYANGPANVYKFDASTQVAKTLKSGETAGKVVGSQAFNTSTGYREYWIVEWSEWLVLTSKGYIEKTKVYVQ